MQLFSGFKMRNIAFFNLNLFAGAGIFGNPGRAFTNRKSAKAAELDTFSGRQRADDLSNTTATIRSTSFSIKWGFYWQFFQLIQI